MVREETLATADLIFHHDLTPDDQVEEDCVCEEALEEDVM